MELPTTLDETYERILAKIDEEYHQEAFAIFNWLIASRRPLTLHELAEAAVVQPLEDDFDPENRLSSPREVLTLCGCLIIFSESKENQTSEPKSSVSTVRFAHYTVQEYLLSGRAKQFDMSLFSSDNFVMASCPVYLQHIKTAKHPSLAEYPLLHYVANHWFNHCDPRNTMIDRVLDLAERFFCENFEQEAHKWLRVHEPFLQKGSWDPLGLIIEYITSYPRPFFYAIRHKFPHVIRKMLEVESPINDLLRFNLDFERLPQHVLRNEEYDSLLRLMCRDPHHPLNDYLFTTRTALQTAIEDQTQELAELLLRSGADPNISPVLISLSQPHLVPCQSPEFLSRLPSPLSEAIRTFQQDVAKLLLDRGARVDVTVGECPVLVYAVRHGLTDTISDLLHEGVDPALIYLPPGWERDVELTALLAACRRSQTDTVRLLVPFCDHSVLDITESSYTAVQMGVAEGSKDIVQILLEAGASPDLVGQGEFELDTRYPNDSTPAMSNNLLEAGGMLPLSIAAEHGDLAMVQILIAAGANVNGFTDASDTLEPNKTYALVAVAAKGHTDIVSLLIASGASVHPPSSQHQHAIAAAAEKGHDGILQILIEFGADVNGGNCVQRAANTKQWSAVRILMKAGAQVDKDLVLAMEQAALATGREEKTIHSEELVTRPGQQ